MNLVSAAKSCHLEIPARRETEHGLDVPAVVPDPVHPHDGDQLEHGDDDHGHPRPVGVHQVEHVLAALGEAGQAQQEAGGAHQARDASLVVPEDPVYQTLTITIITCT